MFLFLTLYWAVHSVKITSRDLEPDLNLNPFNGNSKMSVRFFISLAWKHLHHRFSSHVPLLPFLFVTYLSHPFDLHLLSFTSPFHLSPSYIFLYPPPSVAQHLFPFPPSLPVLFFISFPVPPCNSLCHFVSFSLSGSQYKLLGVCLVFSVTPVTAGDFLSFFSMSFCLNKLYNMPPLLVSHFGGDEGQEFVEVILTNPHFVFRFCLPYFLLSVHCCRVCPLQVNSGSWAGMPEVIYSALIQKDTLFNSLQYLCCLNTII